MAGAEPAKTRGRKRVYDGKGAPELRFRAADPEMAELVAARVKADGAKDVSAWLKETVRRRLGRCEVCGQALARQDQAAGRCSGGTCPNLPPEYPQP